MSGFLHDLAHALRRLAKAPGFCAAVILLLGLGIGSATAVFGTLDPLVLRPVSYPEPERLLSVWRLVNGYPHGQFKGPEFAGVKAQATTFETLAMGCPSDPLLEGEDGPHSLPGARVSREFFRVLGTLPHLGRVEFSEAEEHYGGPLAAILSFGAWRRHFGGDPQAVGRTVVVDGRPCRIVGVLPEGFKSPTHRLRGVDFFEPLALTPEEIANPGANFEVIGRLQTGATLRQADQQLKGIAGALGMGSITLRAEPLADELAAPYATISRLLLLSVGLVLLIVCANVSSLFLARGSQRQEELALRMALGANPMVLARQVLLENLLLGGAGFLAGIWASGLIAKALAAYLGFTSAPPLSGLALGAALGTALAASLLSAGAPAWQAARQHPMAALKAGGRTGTHRGLRAFLVAGEIALATGLLLVAGLLGRSLYFQLKDDLGFRPENTLLGEISLPRTHFPSPEAQRVFLETFEARLKALPGVTEAGLALPIPLVNPGGNGSVRDTHTLRTARAHRHWMTPGGPDALGLRFIAGRPLAAGEKDVCLVSRPLAEALWPGENPLGKRLEEYGLVVGMVEGTKESNLQDRLRAQVHIPMDGKLPLANLLVRADGPPETLAPAIRKTLKELDPRLSVENLQPMLQAMARHTNRAERLAGILAAFAAIALFLASFGIYSVHSYLVARRTREVGLRMALGAQAYQVVALILAQGLKVAAAGVLAGLVLGVLLAHLLRAALFGVSRLDPLACLMAVLGVMVPATLACLLPAARAARVDPAVALRLE